MQGELVTIGNHFVLSSSIYLTNPKSTLFRAMRHVPLGHRQLGMLLMKAAWSFPLEAGAFFPVFPGGLSLV